MARVPDSLKPILEQRPNYSQWLGPDHQSTCTWSKGTQEKSPHEHIGFKWEEPKICDSPLEKIGKTPLIRLHNIPKAEEVKCEMLVKCEYYNTAGSVKDRISVRMIEDAEREGRLFPGGTIIENTGGNTGIGVAYVAAVKGYKCIIVMVDKISKEKEDVLKALGAEVVRTDGKLPYTDPNSDFGVAHRLAEQIPNSLYIGQFRNKSNPLAHYDITAEELLYQCDGKIDMFVGGSGTGGTLTGVGRKLKEVIPDIKIVGIDPVGSIVAFPDVLNESTKGEKYEVEGMGRPFIPLTCDRKMLDRWIKVSDKDGFLMARRLVKEEGILSGGSSGLIFWGALQAAKELGPDQRCVVMQPDSMRNYLTKIFNDDWMVEKGFL